jgi:hypothetical protein
VSAITVTRCDAPDRTDVRSICRVRRAGLWHAREHRGNPQRRRRQEVQMPRTGFIDDTGIGVPDLAAAKRHYDELMTILGLRAWFATTEAGELITAPMALAVLRSSSTKHSSLGVTHAMAPACSTCPSWCLAAPPSARYTTGQLLTTPRSSINPASSPSSPSTASTTPPTSPILTASCSRSSATAPRRRDSQRTGSGRRSGEWPRNGSRRSVGVYVARRSPLALQPADSQTRTSQPRGTRRFRRSVRTKRPERRPNHHAP